MADIGLDDVRGYWRDLVGPTYEDFWAEYQADRAVDRKRLVLIYRRMLCAAFFLNHLADKAARLHRLENGRLFMDMVAKDNEVIGRQLHACRALVNDTKHEAKLMQEAKTRKRDPGYDLDGSCDVLEIMMLTNDCHLHDMCLVVGDAFGFWVNYFQGIGRPNFRQALASQHGENHSS